MSSFNHNKKLLLFISEDWYFWSHRLPLAMSAYRRGWEVYLITRVSSLKKRIEKTGIHLIPLNHFKRGMQNPLQEMRSFIEILKIYRTVKPDIIHQVALKPVVMGTVAARLSKIKSIVNAFAGMGSLFASKDKKISIAIKPILILLRILFKPLNVQLIFQNHFDLDMMVLKRIINIKQATLIKGSGVNINVFRPHDGVADLPLVLMPSRMLWEKGVGEFVEAAKLINANKKKARFVLAGAPDDENPTAIPTAQLNAWHQSGYIEWWGHQDDMAKVYPKAQIVCLPTYYREGLPKVILEAGACGKPVITTDTIGCRDIIKHGKNGLLVQPRNAVELAEAINDLITDPDRRRLLGMNARDVVEKEYSEEEITKQTFCLYEDSLKRANE